MLRSCILNVCIIIPFSSLVKTELLLHKQGVNLPLNSVVQDLLISTLHKFILKHNSGVANNIVIMLLMVSPCYLLTL